MHPPPLVNSQRSNRLPPSRAVVVQAQSKHVVNPKERVKREQTKAGQHQVVDGHQSPAIPSHCRTRSCQIKKRGKKERKKKTSQIDASGVKQTTTTTKIAPSLGPTKREKDVRDVQPYQKSLDHREPHSSMSKGRS